MFIPVRDDYNSDHLDHPHHLSSSFSSLYTYTHTHTHTYILSLSYSYSYTYIHIHTLYSIQCTARRFLSMIIVLDDSYRSFFLSSLVLVFELMYSFLRISIPVSSFLFVSVDVLFMHVPISQPFFFLFFCVQADS